MVGCINDKAIKKGEVDMKEGSKVMKVVGVKKVNRYTKEQCLSELSRLENRNSRYAKDVMERLVVLKVIL